MVDKSLIGKCVEITTGDFAGVWGYIRAAYDATEFVDDYYMVHLWNSSEYGELYKDSDFIVIE